jgi:redox-sensing transcriptional repressor
MNEIPLPVIFRLSYLFNMLEKMEESGITSVSSAELGNAFGQTAHTVRKDIHFLGAAGTAGTKYNLKDLKGLIAENFGYNAPKKCCVVGLGRLGSALLEHLQEAEQTAFHVVAGFDTNINRLETIRTTVNLFPAHRIVETVRRLQVELALIAVPSQQAQEVADRCCDGGVAGLLNFASVVIRPKRDDVFIRSIDIYGELRILSALAFTSKPVVD